MMHKPNLAKLAKIAKLTKEIKLRSELESKSIEELMELFSKDKDGKQREAILRLIDIKLQNSPPDEIPELLKMCQIFENNDNKTSSLSISSKSRKSPLSRGYMTKLCRDPANLKPDEIRVLLEDYPFILHLKSSHDNTLLHMASGYGYKYKDDFEFILDKCLENKVCSSVGMDKGYGGLMKKNASNQSPLAMMYSVVVYYSTLNSQHPRWVWFCSIIEKVAKHFYNHRYGNDDEREILLLHAALEMACPTGVINHILHHSIRPIVSQRDFLGRLPLNIALRNPHTHTSIILDLLTIYPEATAHVDSVGNTTLNLVLHNKTTSTSTEFNAKKSDEQSKDNKLFGLSNNGNKFDSFCDEINLIGRFVEYSPQSLEIENFEQLLPFMSAAVENKWSLGIVYCLLRTSPSVMNEYSI